MARKAKQTIETISEARIWLSMTERFPDMLNSVDIAEKIAVVRDAFNELVEFRNLVRFVAEFDEPTKKATSRYLEL